jgi:hypothetical protein
MPKKSARATEARSTAAIGTWAIGFVMVCVAAAAILFAARQPSQPANITAVETEQQAAATVTPTTREVATPRPQVKKTAAPKTPAVSTLSANTPAPVATTAKQSDVEAVTITGCLEERKDQTFRLKDTDGAEAPKSRSWKSGFIKKGSTSIDLVDAPTSARLHDHVGQRISVTGMLADRELQVRSLRRVAESCD